MAVEQLQSAATIEADGHGRRSLRSARSVGSFASTACLFVFGLIVCLFSVDRALGWQSRTFHPRKRTAHDVLEIQYRARQPGPNVRCIYLGDSVGRQLFRSGSEPSGAFRYLTTNGAVSMAGQYYLLEDALNHAPRVRDVYIFCFPGNLANDLVPPGSHDYFCGCFHEPRQIAEVFAVKRDVKLLAAHVGRFLLPNLLSENSRHWVFEAQASTSVSFIHQPTDPEPLLAWCNRLLKAPPSPTIAPPDCPNIVQSTTTLGFLPKIRRLCESRGIALHLLPVPVSARYRIADDDRPFDAGVIYLPATDFVDGLHFRPDAIGKARQRVISAYHLKD